MNLWNQLVTKRAAELREREALEIQRLRLSGLTLSLESRHASEIMEAVREAPERAEELYGISPPVAQPVVIGGAARDVFGKAADTRAHYSDLLGIANAEGKVTTLSISFGSDLEKLHAFSDRSQQAVSEQFATTKAKQFFKALEGSALRVEKDTQRQVRGGAAVLATLPVASAPGRHHGLHVEIYVAPFVKPRTGQLQRADPQHFRREIESGKEFRTHIERPVYSLVQKHSDLIREIARVQAVARGMDGFFEKQSQEREDNEARERRERLEQLRSAAREITERGWER